ncbi:hypothetical protein [Clostridium niameyense]|nr:hypothetical protein [Clostridium niameyense]
MYGKKISSMSEFIETSLIKDTIKSIETPINSDNLEEIYCELYDRPEHKELLDKLEKDIEDYFSDFKICDKPTVYDFLILALTKKDLIASFNWDPLLVQAYERVSKITDNLPKIVFLHGNVSLTKDSSIPLLYPLKEKDYYKNNSFIKEGWDILNCYLEKAYIVTIFGYKAPNFDKAAIDMLKKLWKKVEDRDIEKIDIIDISTKEELKKCWSDFTYTHHYSIYNNFFDSTLGRFPRRTCECVFDKVVRYKFVHKNMGFKEDMNFKNIQEFVKPLIEDEKTNKDILKNFYL